MPIAQEVSFLGANRKSEPRFLPDGTGTASINQKPAERGRLEPWREPLTISGPNIPAARQTIYRMGRDTASKTLHWLSWTGIVHAIRGFDTSDTTERTYFTGSGSPKWTDNIIGLASAPYPAATRDLGVPPPLVAPTVTMGTDGATGDARQLYYVYTRVNDIGWESAPSPPFLAPLAKPGAVLNLSYSESVPAGNYSVTSVRWYRQQVAAGTDVAEYFFIREYAIGASGQQDDARALGEQLQTEGWAMLDTSATWLTYCWNQFAAAIVGKSVRCCVPNFIYAWPRIEYEYNFNSTPIALAAFAQRLVAFTTAGAEILTGSDPDALDQKPIGLPVLVSQRSLVVGDSWCAWAAEDGLWFYSASGERRNLVGECLTDAQWAAFVPSTIAGYLCYLGDRPLYVGFYNDGALKGFVVDISNPLGFYPLDKGYTTGFYDPLQRALFVLDGATLKEWDAGSTFMTTTWTGKVHRQGAVAEAEWVELLANGSATVKVYTEDPDSTDDTTSLVERMSRTLTRGEHRIPDGTAGRDWQVQISTQGSVQGLAID
jgi:hypothetical protein